ncbi:MAG: hypothetical protein JWO36_6186 [Myxococcales bacterium]|nr:hypothetical protein [Myxococcales bacterium]
MAAPSGTRSSAPTPVPKPSGTVYTVMSAASRSQTFVAERSRRTIDDRNADRNVLRALVLEDESPTRPVRAWRPERRLGPMRVARRNRSLVCLDPVDIRDRSRTALNLHVNGH